MVVAKTIGQEVQDGLCKEWARSLINNWLRLGENTGASTKSAYCCYLVASIGMHVKSSRSKEIQA